MKIKFEGKEQIIKAMLDTGNMLKDPITRKPVAIIDSEIAEKILPKELKGLMDFNPMYQFLTATRTIVVYEQMPTLQTLGIVTLFGVGMLLFGAYVFRKKQDKFIYYI